ncbi:HNH endonuclease domain-containing protein [Aliivibrio fischeri]|uniref:HNH endonuclease domain-containing protein n=1 Tax=Aliivibrio fischeri TaxID=668 RepID=UPI0018C6F010|nr:HNH endonuclease domain-containing protein [Aliivibrio fischeri]
MTSHVIYDDLTEDFLQELVAHYSNNPHQFSRRENKLTKNIDVYLKTDRTPLDWNVLKETARKNIFNDVFRAYQNVGSGSLTESHMLFEDIRSEKRIVLTDSLMSVLEDESTKKVLHNENQARWAVVEEAWKVGITPNILSYNSEDGLFYSETKKHRIGLRSAVDTLSPYQKGRCFYCNRKVSKFVLSDHDDFSDIDHFFPISKLSKIDSSVPNPNGIWNLVVSCKKCNRGKEGKFDQPADRQYYEALVKRNILFFEEHKHSLKNAISLSLGAKSKKDILTRMVQIYKQFQPLRAWKPEYIFRTEDEK